MVRDIFRMGLEGKGNDTIARILQENGILTAQRIGTKKASAGVAKRRSLTLTDGKTAPFVKS